MIRFLAVALSLVIGMAARPSPKPTPTPDPTLHGPKRQVIYLSMGDIRGQLYRHATGPKEKSWHIIARNFGVDYKRLLQANHVSKPQYQPPGRAVLIDNTDIIPHSTHEGIVVNEAQNRLYLFQAGDMALRFPAAVGRDDWRTPLGVFPIVDKQANPSWIVPDSIQAEMRNNGREVITSMPPGPGNPLGNNWIGLGDGSFGIHGTNAPDSVGRYTTHGCIRLRSDKARIVFNAVKKKDTVVIINQPILMGMRGQEVYIDVFPAVRGFHPANYWNQVKRLVADAGVGKLIDWQLVTRALAQRTGIAVYISRQPRLVAQATYLAPRQPKPSPLLPSAPAASLGPPVPTAPPTSAAPFGPPAAPSPASSGASPPAPTPLSPLPGSE